MPAQQRRAPAVCPAPAPARAPTPAIGPRMPGMPGSESGALLDGLSMIPGLATARPERGPNNDAYAHYEQTANGRSGGFGIQSGLIGTPEGWHASSDLLGYNGFQGERRESDGSMTYGESHSVRAAGFNVGYGERGKGAYGEFQADALGADAGATFNPNQGAGLNAGAYWAQAAITAGDIGTDATDRESRIGVGAGVGAAGRLHWADADGDGNREYGFGADIGPVSFDVRSEDPVRDFIPGVGMVSDLLGVDQGTNITNAAGRGLAAAGEGIYNAGATAVSFVGGLFSGW